MLNYALVFILGGIVILTISFLWELMTGQFHAPFVRRLDEMRAADENEKLLAQFVQEGIPPLSRAQIFQQMGWIWKETRGWVFRSRKFFGFFCLFFFLLLYLACWFKTLIAPNSQDLRMLLGGRGWMMYILRNGESS